MISKLLYMLLFVVALTVSCVKPQKYEISINDNAAIVSLDRVGVNVFRVTFTPDTPTWNSDNLRGISIANVYRFNSSGSELIQRKVLPNSDLSIGSTYIYINEFGQTDSILYDGLSHVYDSVGDRNNSWIKYGVAVQYRVERYQGGGFGKGIEGKITLVDAREARPVYSMVINNYALSTVIPEVTFSGFFDTVGVDTLKVYRFSSLRSVDSVGSWIPRIINASTGSMIVLRGRPEDTAIGQVVPVVKNNNDSVLSLMTFSGGVWGDTALYGTCGRPDYIPRNGWAAYFDSFRVDNDGVASFSKKDTLLSGLGNKIILIVPASKTPGVSLWAPIYDDISIQKYVGDLVVDVSGMGESIKIDNNRRLAFAISDTIKYQFNAYGDSSFEGESLYVWLLTRNISSRVLDFAGMSEGGARKFNVVAGNAKVRHDSVNVLSGQVKMFDAFLETRPVASVIGASTIVSDKIEAGSNIVYRVSPFCGQAKGKEVSDLAKLVYLDDTRLLARYVKPGSFLGYKESDLGSFLSGGFEKTDLSKTPVYGEKLNDVEFFNSFGWYDVPPTIEQFTSIIDSYKINVPTYISSFHKKQYYANPINSVPFYLVNQFFADGGKQVAGKEFILIGLTRGRFFKEPRVFVSAFSAPYTYVWDKTPPHVSWSKNYDHTVSEIYAPLYYSTATSSKITNLTTLNNVFDVYLDADDKNDGIRLAVKDLGIGKIKSLTLGFHYADGRYEEDPVTGLRTYPVGSEPVYYSVNASDYGAVGSSITRVAFKGIDARGWRKGFWEMWVESEDDLGNKGLAPIGGHNKFSLENGRTNVRTIEIK